MALLSVVGLIVAGLVFKGYQSGPAAPQTQNTLQGSWERVATIKADESRSSEQASTSSIAIEAGKLNINTATAAQFDEMLPGIGPKKAQTIVEYRERIGAFTHVDQLDEVSGIGAKTMETLRPLVSVGDAENLAQAALPVATPLPVTPAEPPSLPEPSVPVAISSDGRVNINTATAEALAEGLPGVGPVLAQRIIDYRNSHGPFQTPMALDEVKGIGPKKLQDLLPLVKLKD